MRTRLLPILAALALGAPLAAQQDGVFEQAAADARSRLDRAVAELARLHEEIAAETLPMSERLNDLTRELGDLRSRYNEIAERVDQGKLDLTLLRGKIAKHQENALFLGTLFDQYLQEFHVRLHVAELPRYSAALAAARAAQEQADMAPRARVLAQSALLAASLGRLEGLLGGDRFAGAVIGPDGRQLPGEFVLAGPVALFRAEDRSLVGVAEQRINSNEPNVFPFGDPALAEAAAAFMDGAGGAFVWDPTLGNAHKVEITEQETLLDEFDKGGAVMWPIFIMAGLALLIALYKWASLAFIPSPAKSRLRALFEAIARRDHDGARQAAAALRGPAGRMLAAGAAHLGEPRELIEEIMYETVLKTKLKVQRLLPFIAICAASAPLLGLLGTVTGIINTFRMITIYGSSDVKNLSGGISEALITTKWGLIVAIPSLLLHSFLSRRARSVIGRMEGTAVSFLNEVQKAGGRAAGTEGADPAAVRGQVHEALRELLGPVLEGDAEVAPRRAPVASGA